MWEYVDGTYATRLKKSIEPATAEEEKKATSTNERRKSDRMLKECT
jgi:hypothetical protein